MGTRYDQIILEKHHPVWGKEENNSSDFRNIKQPGEQE